jgi:IS1 family transposase
VTILSLDQKSKIIACLCEGVSIRATERLTGHNKNTVMNLGVAVGEGCEVIHNAFMKDIRVSRIELDEVWSYVKKKRRNVTAEDEDTVGDQYIFIAMDSIGKAILSWKVGKRNSANTYRIVEDLRRRVIGEPEFSMDGWSAYQGAVGRSFANSPRGIVDKQIVVIAGGPDSDNYYARETLVKVERIASAGRPQTISTSFIERQNLTLRQSQRRLTRLSNGFSKKFRNHAAAISLYATHYNFCRVHETLRITPAMHLGITDHVWSISEMTEAALTGEIRKPVGTTMRGFRIIQGGLK